MATVILYAAVSLDGFVADEHDAVGPLFDFYDIGDVATTFSDPDRVFHVSQGTADFFARTVQGVGAMVVGRRLFDLTDGWGGVPPSGDHVVVVTHAPPRDWAHAGSAPYHFVEDVTAAVSLARELAGERDVSVSAGALGGAALRAGLVDRVAMTLVPAVLGAGRPFFGTGSLTEPILLDDPVEVVAGPRGLHLLYDVRR